MKLPKLSIAVRLYVTFALMAAMTLALSVVAVLTRSHAALTDEFESTNAGSSNVERVNGLIYAVQAAARAVVMSPDIKSASPYLADLNKSNNQINAVISDWQRNVCSEDAKHFSQFSVRISAFQNFAPELTRIANEAGPQAAHEWAETNFPSDARNELTRDLEALSQHYARRASQICMKIERRNRPHRNTVDPAGRFRRYARGRRRVHHLAQCGDADRRDHPRHRSGSG